MIKLVHKNLVEKTSYIRGILGKRLGKSLRRIPELDFKIDDSIDTPIILKSFLKISEHPIFHS